VSLGGEPDNALSLDWLIDPTTLADFFDNYWEKQLLLNRRHDNAYFSLLPGLDSLDELITATASVATDTEDDGVLVKTFADGTVSRRVIPCTADRRADIHGVYKAYSDGYSVVVNRVHRRSASFASLCRSLERDLHHPVGGNLYLTPQAGQGFRPHVDTHDVFILQLEGVKEWSVGVPTSHLPLAGDCRNQLAEADPPEGHTLHQGDTLYIPRGFPHWARALSSPSLHLTVGIHAYRWTDLLFAALAFVAEADIEFRRALPPQFLDASLDHAHAAELANRLAEAVSDQAVLERAKASLGLRLMGSEPVSSGHFRSIGCLSRLNADSTVVITPGTLCRVRTTTNEATIDFANNYVTGPLLLESALRFIAETQRFVVGELPGDLSMDDKMDLVRRLVSEGLLKVIVSTRKGGRPDD
jgi:ribosomal protein L16 Arg81 hydroxylase